ncbi:acetyl-CoA carboxylase biotin carboxylase subunit [Candidatus Aminicenantes bacterium AC-335-A11]|jgi:acetyl-CoA carboxylase biotin carboxylase subunit|nr:acetyl-CoA carboxylase biotin carboxylase subunit [SCandidatus Aminicenantes bacterium Aminicenantia_JdfR_composite]MCP2596872.1 acetyl-CoA carboxylase biotin carboxylase subunit [Candidatus Aminicenantes bacterium AC-335-G13]MCP2598491.1 acetyl-CoA carboxylase biotin carboxylase subunit [Candidatus Aminicenantes bacterium AC-335-L06]MCP2605833.1 acetyl-CoA carboxylase biotin carboxylase subunit [Candidatus Aminicenantes bacterium AC-335-O07]MCP2606215.1 acetyl-CoA carboxylase biotin carboxy
MFKKILIANRGEIAIRIIKACQELSIQTVAIYSEIDRKSLHVQMADEAICIGPPPPLESYLNIDAIISAAKKTKAEAIHPGYGFLAENPTFARRCEEEGIIFIGPNSKALALVGDKVESRKTLSKIGIPIIPGMKSSSKNLEIFYREAEQIGYPVMIKASAGGGGKGMRIVWDRESLKSSIEAGMREAKSAFGDESVYLEKYLEKPRHIEFQVLADNYGNVVHLFERECSIQRRHQKIVEETPSPALSPELREEMGEVAKKVIKAVGYNNAGTVEFLLDRNKKFYFLEVNARIQVEHPITELTTGVDLVKQQILIASGEKLPFSQEELSQRGHSIECRIYAEDPYNNFLPSSGKILFFKEPVGPGIRHDCGIYSGYEVSIYYDPILAKLIVWAEDRESACKKMLKALDEYVILGIKNIVPFLKEIISHPEFLAGNTHTNFVDDYFLKKNKSEKEKKNLDIAVLCAGIYSHNKIQPTIRVESEKIEYSPWKILGKWRLGQK